MRRFLVVDHSLLRIGGHEFDYAANALRAAEAAGFRPALAAHRRFRDGGRLPGHWQVHAVFPDAVRTRHCVSMGGHAHVPLDTDGRRLPPEGPRDGPGLLAPLLELHRLAHRRRRIRRFATACAQAFESAAPVEGDHVFFVTITEFDLLGLARFLSSRPETRAVRWHLQFHFDLYAGCGRDPARRERVRSAVARQCRHALDLLRDHSIRLYTTTESLAAQYNALGVSAFRHLPYPVSPELGCRPRVPGRPLRVTCAGGSRREKRFRDLAGVTRVLRDGPPLEEAVEFAVEIPPGKLRGLGLADAASARESDRLRALSVPPPLPPEDYRELIRETDIGLFLYDSERYRVRCSGILLEMLAAGKPVIVPAGCWLAEQVAATEALDTGRVGLIAQNIGDVPRLLRKMVENYAGYRAAAEAFSPSLLAAHHPARVIHILTTE